MLSMLAMRYPSTWLNLAEIFNKFFNRNRKLKSEIYKN